MEAILQGILDKFGWSSVGWIIAAIVVIRTFIESRKDKKEDTLSTKDKDMLDRYDVLVRECHEAVKDNTRVTERLAMLIEERTRQRYGPKG